MEEDEKGKKKKMILFLGAMFVAVIFLSSYASFGMGTTTTTVSTVKPNTYFATGNAVAQIARYGSSAYVQVTGADNTSLDMANETMSKLQNNGSISNFLFTGSGYQVALTGIDAYSLQQQIRDMPGNGIANANATSVAYIVLPARIRLDVGDTHVNATLANRNFSLPLTGLEPVGSNLSVRVSAMITANGSIYNNEIRINVTS